MVELSTTATIVESGWALHFPHQNFAISTFDRIVPAIKSGGFHMTDIRTGRCSAHTALVFLASTMLHVPAFAVDFTGRWGASVDIGGQIGNGRKIGETALFVPLWQNSDSLLFTDIRGMFDNQQAREGNFGLGVRHMLGNGWNLGAYGYFDVRRSALGNTFQQATIGFEALSENLDFRGNVYLPVGGSEKTIGMGGSSTTYSAPHLVLTGTQLGIQTTSTTTTGWTTVTEKAMRGVDAEVGVRLPVFPEELKLDMRAFVGGYHFEADGVRDISGPRGRLELTARDFAGLSGARLTAGVTYQNDNVRGDQWIASARLRVPLQAPSTLSDTPPLSYMESRMTDAVVRDVDIVSNSRTETATSTTTQVLSSEAAINTWNGQTVTSVVQVDAAAGQTGLQGALDGGGGAVVIANGDFDAAATATYVRAQTTLLGGGMALRVRGANSGTELDFIAPGAAGSISGSLVGSIGMVRLSDDSVVAGMRIEHNNPVLFVNNPIGIEARSISNAYIIDNVISTESEGGTAFGVRIEDSENIWVIGNTISAWHPTANAVAFQIVSGSGLVQGNTLYASGSSGSYSVFLVDTYGRAPEFLPGSVGNVEISGTCLLNGAPGSAIGSIGFVDDTFCP